MNITHALERGRKAFPNRTALVFEDESWSYARLDHDCGRAARVLANLGIDRGDRVALWLPNSPAFVFAYFGALKLGAVVVAINPQLKAGETGFLLGDSTARILVTTAALADSAPEAISLPERVLVTEEAAADMNSLAYLMGAAEPWDTGVTMNPDEPAAILYTSGTTGFPKGAVLTHGNIVTNGRACVAAFGLTPGDRVLLCLPIYHCFGQNAALNPCFEAGATLLLHRQFGPAAIAQSVAGEAATVFFGVPTLYDVLLEQAEAPDWQGVRQFISAAFTLPPTLAVAWQSRFGRPIQSGYGLTETCLCCFDRDPTGASGSVGTPLEGVEVKVIAADGQDATPGEIGELAVRGANVMPGYWNRPQATTEAFRNGWFLTGDIGCRDEVGGFRIVDRVKDMVNVGGVKVYPSEVEAVLARHPAVAEAAVYGVTDSLLGERVAATVVLRTDQIVPLADLLDFCARHLAGFKLPVEIEAVEVLPKSPTGKILKRALAARHGKAPAPVLDHTLEFWPAIEGYYVYDALLYNLLANDLPRNRRYQAAIERTAPGRVVVEIGTGATAILSRLCIEAGASKVYAIERGEEAFQQARALIEKLGLSGQIEVIQGDATQVSLPEPADVCVSEIVGGIGGSQGAAVIINKVRHLLKPDGIMIPERSATRIAAVSLPDSTLEQPFLPTLAQHYTREIFKQVGYPFDVRLCVKGFSEELILSDSGLFEDLDHSRPTPTHFEMTTTLTIRKPGRLDGFLLWLELHTIKGEVIDILKDSDSWLPIYFPVFQPGLYVEAGDIVEAVCSGWLSDNGLNPDYRVCGQVVGVGREGVAFDYLTPHHSKVFCATPFHQRVFASLLEPVAGSAPLDGRIGLTGSGGSDHRHALLASVPPGEHSTRIVAYLGEQVVRLLRQDSGVTPDFRCSLSQLGLDSLMIIDLRNRVTHDLAVTLPVATFLDTGILGLAETLAAALATETGTGDTAIMPVPRDPTPPLSYSQEEVWRRSQNPALKGVYNLLFRVGFTGRLDTEALYQGFVALIERHELLRTTFPTLDGMPVQVIAPTAAVSWTVMDLSALPDAERAQQSERLAEAEERREFDLAQGPLLRATLLHLGETGYLLLIAAHHIILDAWSVNVLLTELGTLYTARVSGYPAVLPLQPIQYADFAAWQRRVHTPESLMPRLSYWQALLSDLPPDLDLPTDRPRSPETEEQTHPAGIEWLRLPPELVRCLKDLGRHHDATFYTVLLAGYAALLGQRSRCEGLVIGTPTSKRDRPELETLLGHLAGRSWLRLDLSGEPTFAELLQRTRQAVLEALVHQYLTLRQWLEATAGHLTWCPQRPLTSRASFNLWPPMTPTIELPDATLQFMPPEYKTIHTDIALNLWEVPAGDGTALHGFWLYRTDLFEPASIASLVADYGHLLQEVIAVKPEAIVERETGKNPMIKTAKPSRMP